MVKIYYDSDADLDVLKGKTVAVIGYGSQGHAQSQNLHDSGLDVVVGLRKTSSSWSKAESDGLNVMDIDYAIDWYFQTGDGPPCLEEADPDGSGIVDVEDLVYLVKYVFMSGPEPVVCPSGPVVLGR